MINKQDDLDIVSEFLIRFYHEEPDYIEATIRALNVLRGRDKYKWELANSFRNILEKSLPPETLKEVVLFSANRYVRNDEEAREVLEKIYQDNVLDAALNFDELMD